MVNLISSSLTKSRIKSFVCDPGTFASNITLSLVPWFFEYPIRIFYRLLQPLTPKLTGNTQLATSSLKHVFENYSTLAPGNVKVKTFIFRKPIVFSSSGLIERDP